MPIYAYKCSTCGYAKDMLRKVSDLPLTDCPECGSASFQKQVTAAGFQLKGSGWYATDFRGDKKSSAGPADSESASKTDAGANSKTDSASATSSNDKTGEKSSAAATDKVSEKKSEAKTDSSAKTTTNTPSPGPSAS